MWCDHDSLLSIGWDLLWSNCIPNLKSFCSSTMKIRKAMQNVETGGLGSLAISPFDREHMTSYLTNKNYASILYHFWVIMSYSSIGAYFNLHHLKLASPLWWAHSNFTKTFGIRNWSPLASLWRYFHDSLCLAITTQYQHVTDRQTHDDSTYHATRKSCDKKMVYI